MNLDIETLSKIYPEQIWVEISDSDLEQAELATQSYSNETGRNHAYMNRLCLNAFLNWMRDNLELERRLDVSPSEAGLPAIWEIVNGTAIAIGSKRLVLIPNNALDTEDFVVPQEWVDIPSWASDYYLPVQVDLDNHYLHIWGFVSRRTLQVKGEYDFIYRTYYIEREHVIANLELLWVACHLCRDEKGEVRALPTLSNREAKDLIEQLSKPSAYSPRLEVKFEQWGALLNQSIWLQELYKWRQRDSLAQTRLVQLSRWLDNVFVAGCQTFEEFSYRTPVPAFRSKRVRGVELDTREKVRKAIQQLYNSRSGVVPADLEGEDALVYLLQTTQSETVRWQAAEYLWTIDPHHPNNAIRRIMDSGIQLMGHSVALMVGVLRKSVQIAVLLRIYSLNQNHLPPGIRLIVLDEKGVPIQNLEAIARSEPLDEYIQLYFCADAGDYFSVNVTLEGASITEYFVA